MHGQQNVKILAIAVRTTRFNIQKFYMVLTFRLCILYGSHNKQRLSPYTILAEQTGFV